MLAIFVALALRTSRAAPPATMVDIFTSGTSANPWSLGKAVAYRIPSLVTTAAAAAAVAAADGTAGTLLLAFASERLSGASDESNTNLVMRRSADGGATWSNMTLVVSAEVRPPFAPKTTYLSSAPWAVADAVTGDVLLFYNQNSTEGVACACSVWRVRSSDGGRTWSAPAMLPTASGVVGSSLNSGITLRAGPHKGRLLMCMRRICKNSCPGPWQSFAAYSDDRGATWQASPYLEEGSTECQLAELAAPPGAVYMAIRPYKELLARSGGKRASAVSADGGATWGPVGFEPQLANAGGVDGSVVSAGAAADGSSASSGTLFFSHPDAGGRSNMTLYTSRDDAQTWAPTVDVYSGGAAYSSLAMLAPAPAGSAGAEQAACRVGLAFEKDGYKSIAFAAMAVAC